ncbi:MAG: hypothetical protein ACFCVK_12870 [Acidimicrobiales bacterium]
MSSADIEISLDAVIVAVTDGVPRLLTIEGPDGAPALPSGLLEPQDETLEIGLRRWVQEQTGLALGYAEQLYTFGDRVRGPSVPDEVRRLSIAYLALVGEGRPSAGASWQDIYAFFPWEDHRRGRPVVIDAVIRPALARFAEAGGAERAARSERVKIAFGDAARSFDGVRVLERYELLYEVGLLHEAVGGRSAEGGRDDVGVAADVVASRPMYLDHRRIAATALGRLRGKLTYRPVVFELLPPTFTLLQLQRLVEALAGVGLHKQNFRRLVESAGLVEGTGAYARTGGRPAELFRFRREVLGERPRPGVGRPWVRT